MAKQREQHHTIEQEKRAIQDALIGDQVLHALGQPSDLLRLQICKLWDGHYRANVFTGVDIASARVSDSYFLVADADGVITASTPAITRRYQVKTAIADAKS